MITLHSYLEKLESRRLAALLMALLSTLFIFTEAGLRNDFDIFLSASQQLFEGKNIYQETYFDGYHYYYSTLFAVLIYPLTLLPAFVAKSFWIVLNLLCIFRLLVILNPWLASMSLSKIQGNLIKLLVLIFCLRFLKGNIHLGQMTIFILYLSLESIHQMNERRPVLASVLLAFAINIKVLPIVLLPYLIYRSQWKMLFGTCLVLSLLAFLPGIVIGFEQNTFLLGEWWALVNPSQSKHLLDVEETSFHGLSTVLPILLMESTPDRSTIDISRNIMDLSFEQVSIVIHSVRLLFVVATLWFLRTLPFRKAPSKVHEWWELSYIFLCIPLIFPHQQHYAFLFLWPALAYLVGYTMQVPNKGIYAFFLTIVFLCLNASLLLGFGRPYFDHFKIVTIGAFITAVMLFCARPDKLSLQQTS